MACADRSSRATGDTGCAPFTLMATSDSAQTARAGGRRKEERMDTMRPSRRRRLRATLAGAAGLAVGLALGGALLLGTARRAAGDANPLPSLDPARLIDATHVPPLITVP